MRCPSCGYAESKVVDSRPADDGASIRRRRECLECSNRFTTYERREELPLVVIKSDGRREPFDRQKIMRGLVAATVKRDLDVAQLDALIDSVENELRDGGITEVPSKRLGEMVLLHLRDIDDVAYVRFASVYREFKDVNTFLSELKKMLDK